MGGHSIEQATITWKGRALNPPYQCSPAVEPAMGITKFRTAQCPDGYMAGNWKPQYNLDQSQIWYAAALYEPDVCWRYPPANQKNLGSCPCPYAMAGNPIHVATGNKYEEATDFSDPRGRLSFVRSYNSQSFDDVGLGKGWRHTFQRSIFFQPATVLYGVALTRRSDGKTNKYARQTDGTYTGDADVSDKLTKQVDGSGNSTWVLRTKSDESETYDDTGKLLFIDYPGGTRITFTYTGTRVTQVQDSFGRSLNLSYDSAGRLIQVVDPAGGQYTYVYDVDRHLTNVVYPDTSFKTYLYNEAINTGGKDLPFALTGIVDENGSRYATFKYDSTGRAVSSEHAGGAQRTTFTFNANSTTTIVDALGASRTLTFTTALGTFRQLSSTQPCAACGGSVPKTTSYDANGNVTAIRDFNNNGTNYFYDLTRNLELWRIEGYPANQRLITTTWHPTLRLPATVTEPVAGGSRVTTFTYDTVGNVTRRTTSGPRNDGTSATVTRQWDWSYNANGQVLTATDPNGNVTTTTYYATTDSIVGRRGAIATVTNALGHVTTYSTYDGNGRPTTIIDANGLVITLTYNQRGGLTSRSIGGETTTFVYDLAGQLTRVTSPDGSYVTYLYDAAHRLTQIADGLGNKIVYTLDAMGNRTKEEVFDVAGVLARTRSRTFDLLNRLAQDLGALGQTTAFAYDASGRMTATTDPLNRTTSSSYDSLNRVVQVLDPAGTTTYSYDAAGNLAQVTDARGNGTSYTYDALGNQNKLSSPDTGISLNTFDSYGNLLTRIDARGVMSSYTFDTLNRVAQVSHSKSGTTTETYAYTYDVGVNAKGRLTRLADPVAITAWSYSSQGRVASKTQTIGSVVRVVQYSYNASGQLSTTTTPSGQQIGYTYLNNRIASVTVNGAPLIGGIVSAPFGPIGAWQWANSLYTFRYFDIDGRLASWQFRNGSALLRNDLSYDAAGRITAIDDPITPVNTGSYQYDAVDRLTVAQQSIPIAHTAQYGYDALGNRLTSNFDGDAIALTYPATSNKLQTMSGTVSGSYMSGASTLDFSYSNANRLTSVQSSGLPLATYGVSGLGQRVKKTVGGTTTLFVYDEQGRLLGEYDDAGTLLQETVWLDNLPIATLRPTGPGNPTPIAIYYVHSDHLGSPRAVTRPSDNAILWRWDNIDAFGNNVADENPTGLGVFKYALRLPGQYFDAETGTHYNYFRDYDPALGRYTQSDPIGLYGGINTYTYVKSDPLGAVDPKGLIKWTGSGAVVGVNKFFGAAFGYYDLVSECIRGTRWEVKVSAKGVTAAITPIAVGGGASSIEFEDGLDWANPYVFNGEWLVVSNGYAAGPIGTTRGATVLGGAVSGYSKSDYLGWDFTLISGIIGSSTVTSAQPIGCACP